MNIRGINKFTLIDYPGKVACIIFVGNCNFTCPYCHNPFLVVDPGSQPQISEKDFFSFLEKRKNKLDSVVISGGEPTLKGNLLSFSKKIKEMGFSVKLDTNASNSNAVKELHSEKCLDYLGIDFKCPINRYHEMTRINMSNPGEEVQKTISYAVKHEIPYDIRTTVHKALLSEDDLFTMRKELDLFGVKEWTLQQFNPAEILDDDLLKVSTYSNEELINIAKKLPQTKVRGIKQIKY